MAFLNDNKAGNLSEATRVHVDLYARHLESLEYSANTRAQRLAAISSFYEYSCLLGAMSSNPAAKVRRPKLSKYSPRLGLNLDTAPPVIEAAEKLGETHAGIVALCLFAGLRIS
jgi:site-specific recombinase XerD